MHFFIKKINYLLVIICIAIFINACQSTSFKPSNLFSKAKEATHSKICTGPQTGTYYHYANGIIDAAKDTMNIQLSNLSTVGTQENALKIASGECSMALVQEDIYYQAGSRFNQFVANKGTVLALYKEPVHILVNKKSGIQSIADLAGKKINVGEEESGTLITANMILNVLHRVRPEPDYFFDSPADAVSKVCDGTYDAAFYVAALPIPALSKLPKNANIALIPATIPVFSYQYDIGTIPAGTYPWLDYSIEGNIEMRSLLAIGPDIDRTKIPNFLDTVFKRKEQYAKKYHHQWKNLTKYFNVKTIKHSPFGWNEKSVYYFAEKKFDPKSPDSFFCSNTKGSFISDIAKNLIPIANATFDMSLSEKNTNGSLDNLQMLYEGKCAMGIIQQDIYSYLLSQEDNTYPSIQNPMLMYSSVDQIMPVLKKEFHIILKSSSKIKSISDLKGKRINIGNKNSDTQMTARTIFMTNAIKNVISYYHPPDIAINNLLKGKIDAIFMIDSVPSKHIVNAVCPINKSKPGCLTDKLKNLPIKFLKYKGTAFHDNSGVFTKSAYPFIKYNIKRVPEISWVLAVAPGFDDSRISNFIQAVYKNAKTNESMKNINLKAGKRYFKRFPNNFNYNAASYFLKK